MMTLTAHSGIKRHFGCIMLYCREKAFAYRERYGLAISIRRRLSISPRAVIAFGSKLEPAYRGD